MCFSITADLVVGTALVHMVRRRRLPDPHRLRGVAEERATSNA
ncbi:hypothetical protein [Mycobacterium colombiense]|nr:hypothetical protein [Mycobacterium colombiense]